MGQFKRRSLDPSSVQAPKRQAPQAWHCPHCPQKRLTEGGLADHVNQLHADLLDDGGADPAPLAAEAAQAAELLPAPQPAPADSAAAAAPGAPALEHADLDAAAVLDLHPEPEEAPAPPQLAPPAAAFLQQPVASTGAAQPPTNAAVHVAAAAAPEDARRVRITDGPLAAAAEAAAAGMAAEPAEAFGSGWESPEEEEGGAAPEAAPDADGLNFSTRAILAALASMAIEAGDKLLVALRSPDFSIGDVGFPNATAAKKFLDTREVRRSMDVAYEPCTFCARAAAAVQNGIRFRTA